MVKTNIEKDRNGTIYKCDNRITGLPDTPGYFLPMYVGDVGAQNEGLVTFSGRCFQNITFSYSSSGLLDNVKLVVKLENPVSLFCHDWFLFGTTEFIHVEDFFYSGTHVIEFQNLDYEAKVDVYKNGISIYMFCSGYIDTFVSAFKVLKAFLGGLTDNPHLPWIGSHIPEYMEEANLEFLEATMNYTLEKRPIQKIDD